MNTTSPSMKVFDNTAMVLAVDIVDQKSNFKVACVGCIRSEIEYQI